MEDNASNNFQNRGRANSEAGIYENEVPLVGYTLGANNT